MQPVINYIIHYHTVNTLFSWREKMIYWHPLVPENTLWAFHTTVKAPLLESALSMLTKV